MSLEEWLIQRHKERESAGLERRLTPREPHAALVDLAGNDYLGLSTDERVTRAAAEAALTWGAGAGASRLVTGTLTLHGELETELAAFCRQPSALVFSTGYHANLGAVAALCDPDTLLVSDAHIHASLVDACRLSHRARVAVVPHNDVGAVDATLRGRDELRALVLCESVYSVLGDAAPLVELAHSCAQRGAVLVVDEAHALGVSGEGGRGLVESSGLAGRPDVVVTLTLSKALGSQGGAVLGSPELVRHLVNAARPFIYDTGLAPAAAAGALAALRVVAAEPGLPARAKAIAGDMAAALGVPAPAAAVLSVPMASPEAALVAQAGLADDGFRVGCFRPPSVPDGVSRLRLTGRATLTDADRARVVARLRALSPA